MPEEKGPMAYPEPIPAIKGKHAKEFLERLSKFKLTPREKDIYRNARANFRKMSPKETEDSAEGS